MTKPRKPATPERPRQGGSYTLNPDTGKLTRREHTRPPEAFAPEPGEPAAAAPVADQPKEA